MNSEDRRQKILRILRNSEEPVPGRTLSEQLDVSRQVIVQDIALLRANGTDVYSTNRGYVVPKSAKYSRVYKVIHSDEELEEELLMIVDLGGTVEDVFIYHRAYDVIRGELNLSSRLDVEKYMVKMRTGQSSPLKNITNGYHYHTISASSEQILDIIQQKLHERGFLAQLTDYEPVSFR